MSFELDFLTPPMLRYSSYKEYRHTARGGKGEATERRHKICAEILTGSEPQQIGVGNGVVPPPTLDQGWVFAHERSPFWLSFLLALQFPLAISHSVLCHAHLVLPSFSHFLALDRTFEVQSPLSRPDVSPALESLSGQSPWGFRHAMI